MKRSAASDAFTQTAALAAAAACGDVSEIAKLRATNQDAKQAIENLKVVSGSRAGAFRGACVTRFQAHVLQLQEEKQRIEGVCETSCGV